MPDRDQIINKSIAAWTERAAIAERQGQQELHDSIQRVITRYQALAETSDEIPTEFSELTLLRKRIEASEAHRTMSAEHGLGDEAIDTTYEIQELEKQLIELVKKLIV